MTDAITMKTVVAEVIRERLAHLSPLPAGGAAKQNHPQYNVIRAAILETEQELRNLIKGGEDEVHEWLAVIHYALADERERLL